VTFPYIHICVILVYPFHFKSGSCSKTNPSFETVQLRGTCELFMTEDEQLSSSWAGTVHLNSFHIFTEKIALTPEGYRAVSLTQGH
jgi:hypothetical protein